MTAPPATEALADAVDSLVRRLAARARDDAAERLTPYVALVAEWNARTNLTAARTATAFAEILCADALVAADPGIVPNGARFVDVGSGGGAPAIPLALLRDDLTGVLVEPLRKRVAFLRTAIGSLALERRLRVIEGRVDPEDPQVTGGPFGVALSRATFAPFVWARAGAMLAPRVLCFLGAEPFEVPADLETPVRRSYALPSSEAPRTLLALSSA